MAMTKTSMPARASWRRSEGFGRAGGAPGVAGVGVRWAVGDPASSLIWLFQLSPLWRSSPRQRTKRSEGSPSALRDLDGDDLYAQLAGAARIAVWDG